MDRTAEWLEADGLGGFASGTVSGVRTRRYHALLLAALRPPTERVVLVNGFDAWVEQPEGVFALSSQAYSPDVVYPDGAGRLVGFEAAPWPRWTYRLEDGAEIEQELFVRHGAPLVVLSWRLVTPRPSARLLVRPFFSGRDYHAMHHENPSFQFTPERLGDGLLWHQYPGLPGVLVRSSGAYAQQPDWYRNFWYREEQARGLDCREDLASPGVFQWDLARGEAVLVFSVDGGERDAMPQALPVHEMAKALRVKERDRRAAFPTRLHRAADAYVVQRGEGRTIVAGYPWFTDWGRDTFISLRGLCVATGRFEEARAILLEWASAVSEGMLPNRFPDRGTVPEFNAVDASLWYVVAVHDFLEAMESATQTLSLADRTRLSDAVEAILAGYAGGTRYGIRLDDDGLVAAGVPGAQLTWMDAKVGDWVVTPRIGKPVEVQALWLNALWIGRRFSTRWDDLLACGRQAFRERFWYAEGGYLYDVVDVDHQAGKTDASFRPNQIFAVGGLPLALLDGEQARQVVNAVEARLWTPLGLRSLAPEDAGYVPQYQGGVLQRDGAYHQGTVWPWLLGPFVEAWVLAREDRVAAKQAARTRFLEPLLRHLDEAGLGHISEIADGDPPYRPRGCPFQAWSVGEALRLSLVVLAK